MLYPNKMVDTSEMLVEVLSKTSFAPFGVKYIKPGGFVGEEVHPNTVFVTKPNSVGSSQTSD